LLGGLLPLFFLATTGVCVRGSVLNSLAASVQLTKPEVLSDVSLGAGAYLTCLVSLYFAVAGVWQFLKDKGNKKPEPTSRRAAA
jgi:hypothetical protein